MGDLDRYSLSRGWLPSTPYLCSVVQVGSVNPIKPATFLRIMSNQRHLLRECAGRITQTRRVAFDTSVNWHRELRSICLNTISSH